MLDQDERLLREMDTIQQQISYKRWELDPNRNKKKKSSNGYQLLDRDVLLEVPPDVQAEFAGERFLSIENM
jgi:hypothetical protein